MQVLKKYVRKANSPCAQVLKTYFKVGKLGGVPWTKNEIVTTINTKFLDSWFLTKSNRIIQVERINNECLFIM